MQKNEEKLRKLVQFVYEQKFSPYHSVVRWIYRRLSQSLKQMSITTLWLLYGSMAMILYGFYLRIGQSALIGLPLVCLCVWLTLLQFTNPDDAIASDYKTIEVAATAMLGMLPDLEGTVKVFDQETDVQVL